MQQKDSSRFQRIPSPAPNRSLGFEAEVKKTAGLVISWLLNRGIVMKAHRLSSTALLGSTTAVLAMLTGLAGARADDLKVNQQLLSERLDQLAAVGLQPGAGAYLGHDQGPAAGAPVSGGSFPRSILIPGTETSLKIYGQISEVMDYWMSGGNPNASPQ